MIPLRRIVEDVVAAGYEGPFELEILGPRVEAEGAPAAVRRGAAWVSGLLDAVGVRR
jgi:sugar phosphate isomerase/epimerase